MKNILSFFALLCATSSTLFAQSASRLTEQVYLSGRGCDDMVEWDFYCTGGNNSGKWTKIGVPSCWELQGFGTYQYGMKFYGKAFPEGIADEKGMYRYEFNLPAAWNGRQVELIFEAVMTDAEVKINGRKAGTMHQGGFYRFIYDVSDRVFTGDKKNVLEVTVSKESTNAGVNLSERRADYWNFGGIYRPVFMRSKPALNVAHVAIDADMHGRFKAQVELNRAIEGAVILTEIIDEKGKKVASHRTPVRPGGSSAEVDLIVKNASLWTAETPHRYTARFSLLDAQGDLLHCENEKFGFRTIETRESDGLYINGVRVNIRGVNRHSFRPESGRTLSPEKNIEDVLLIKSMNMNSVRLSHYPADPEFLDACDSLGLYVMNELTGWHGKHETIVGQKLVKEMVTRDVNHPSVIWWSNGNEKGWNTELDGEFHKYDPQRRPVLHPQGNFGGYETMHYRSYGESQNYMRLPEIFMPTEFLHGLYDGGHGAGLYDYWEMMRKHPRCIGGFLWVLADEGVKRVDMDGFIDNVGNYGADGIVGPHHEKEGSYWTIREVWCPVQLLRPEWGDKEITFDVENRYDFRNLNTCNFRYEFIQLPAMATRDDVRVLKSGTLKGKDVAPHASGKLTLPAATKGANALRVTVIDGDKEEIMTWAWPLSSVALSAATKDAGAAPKLVKEEKQWSIEAGGRTYLFDAQTGLLQGVKVSGRSISLQGGPRFVAAKRSDRSMDQFYNHDDKDAEKKKTQYTTFDDAGKFTGFSVSEAESAITLTARYRLGSLDSVRWVIGSDGVAEVDVAYNFAGVVDLMGIMFDYPESKVEHKRWVGDGPYRVWQNRLHGPQIGLWENEYNDPIPGESFTYPEFKGYFANVSWMTLRTSEGSIHIGNRTAPDANPSGSTYIGVYQPKDGRDQLLYTLPETGISLLHVIPPVRNKVNTTDLVGPSSQAHWAEGNYTASLVLKFE